MRSVDRHTIERKNRTMDATYNFSLGFAQGREPETERPNRSFNGQTLQIISTEVSLISLFLGFSIFGILAIVNQHRADVNDLSGGSSFATVGGIGSILVGAAFLVAACIHWRYCAQPFGMILQVFVRLFQSMLLDRFANGSCPVINRSSSCSRHVR
jgi:uncharacterized membrane protein YdcZ (DUF606 family)